MKKKLAIESLIAPWVAGALLLLPLLVLSACNGDAYHQALSASAKVSDTVHEAIQATSTYYAQGKLTDDEKAVIANYLQNVTVTNMTFRKNITDLHNSGITGISAYIQAAQAFVDAVPTDPLAFHYKSADSQAKFNTVL